MTRLNLDFVRSQFPPMRDAETRGWAFFENAGGSCAPDQVVDKLDHFFRRTKVQPYYPYGPSEQAGEAMDRSQELWARCLNVEPEEIQLGPSTTINEYVLAQALRAEMQAGDRVIVTEQDHEANIGAWARLADTGIDVRYWTVDPESGLLDVAALQSLLNERTRLVCFTHCSNVCATINPVREITELCHQAGARVVVDGVSYAPHAALDLRALGVDFYLFSLYKTYGPHIGLMYVRRDHLEHIQNQGHFFNAASLTKRLTPAGPDHGEIACASGVIDYFQVLYDHHQPDAPADSVADMAQQVFQWVGQHEQQLMEPLLDFLGGRSSVRVLGHPRPDRDIRVPTIAFTSERADNQAIAAAMADRQVGVGFGHFYAYRLMEAVGIDPASGVTRLSLVHYNTPEEVERAIQVLDPLV